jgi:UDP-N-acetyl-2-amino-2-deoxyglucuronate dehydrogenase
VSRALGVAVIGAGRVFEQHARAWRHLASRARLLGISDVDEARLRAATRAHFLPFASTDHRVLLDRSDIDVVTVCTPPSAHERVVVEALQAGKHVVCEKPLAHTLEAADRIVDAARRHPGRLSVVHQFRYLPEVRATVRLRDQGHLGPLLFGRFSRYARNDESAKPGTRPGKARKAAKVRAGWWGRWDTAGGGAAMTQLIHELDLACHLFGRPVEVSATMDTLKEAIESEDTCAATVRFAGGAIVCCFGTVAAQRSTHGFDVIGQWASTHLPWSVECANPASRKEVLRDLQAIDGLPAERTLSARLRGAWDQTAGRLLGARTSTAAPSAHAPYLRAVLDAIAAGEPLPVGPEEARRSVELCVALYSSALTGRPVSLPLPRTNPYYGGVTPKDYDGRDRTPARAGLAASTGRRTGT